MKKAISVDLINTNSLFTLDKTLNSTFIINTASKNDTLIVNFGDNNSKSYQLNSGII